MRTLMLCLLLILPVHAEGVSLRLQIYDPGQGPVRFILRVENLTGAPVQLTQPTSQTHDFSVTRGDGREVWRWSGDKFFMQMLTDRVFKPGEVVTYTGEWDRAKAQPGKYTVKAWLPVVEGNPPSITRPLKI